MITNTSPYRVHTRNPRKVLYGRHYEILPLKERILRLCGQRKKQNFITFVVLLTSQRQILCSLVRIYRVGYKYHLLRHISQIRDANPQALFGRSNYQPSRKPFLLYVEVAFRSSFLLSFVSNTTRKQVPTEMIETISDYSYRLTRTPTATLPLQTMTSKWRS